MSDFPGDFHAQMARLAARLRQQARAAETGVANRPQNDAEARPAYPVWPSRGEGGAGPLFADPQAQTQAQFEAALGAVQRHFSHLSIDDIAWPPRGWFDAALARQIAVHVTIERLQVKKRQLARELAKNRGHLAKALAIVEARMTDTDFRAAYEAIAQDAEQGFRGESS
jgi:hypothetical protein